MLASERAPGAAMAEEPIERASLCLPDITRGVVAHHGEDGFGGILKQYYNTPENDALERLILLKKRLKDASTHDFWSILLREVCDVGSAQCGFVSKRAAPDAENTSLEMPLLNRPGSYLQGVGFYLNAGDNVDQMHHNYQYHLQDSSCFHMESDKVVLIPEKLNDYVKSSWGGLPWENLESYLGIPLSRDGDPFAHFAMVWTVEGAVKRKLSWAFLELFMHSLEDIILERLLEDKEAPLEESKPTSQLSNRIVPIDAITASQTLKPYARSLSHELRTPMQGVVGMLDMMYSTVMESIASQMYPKATPVFEDLKANIETAQDSSKRAVEAVDNVVHAYDLNMQMPETLLANDDLVDFANPGLFSSQPDPFRPDIVIEGSGIPLTPATNKRERDDDLDFHPGPPMKRLPSITEEGLRKVFGDNISPTTSLIAEADESLQSLDSSDGLYNTCELGTPHTKSGGQHCKHRESYVRQSLPDNGTADLDSTDRSYFSHSPSPSFPFASPDRLISSPAMSPPPLFNRDLSSDRRHISSRTFIHNLVDQAISSMHPFEKVRIPHKLGEIINVKTAGPRGDVDELKINIMVGLEVPERIITKESHLTFAVMKVVDNAIKFTPNGEITVSMKLSRNGHLMEIRVIDTGCGISEEFKEHLFKPHFQENSTISRSKDGLGLSLFNAKAHVRRSLRGEMTLERSAIGGVDKGSEFLIRFPVTASSEENKQISLSPKISARTISNPVVSPHGSPLLSKTNGYAAYPSPHIVTQPFNIIATPTLSCPPKKQSFDRHLASKIPLNFLIAEDNAINRNILVGYLKKLGYAPPCVTLAFDGAEAVAQYAASLSASGPTINAVLMDLWMPNMDGYEATEHILKMAERRDGESAPVVFAVSADITSDSLSRAKGVGMRGFISKPYRVMDIQKLIMEHFGEVNEA